MESLNNPLVQRELIRFQERLSLLSKTSIFITDLNGNFILKPTHIPGSCDKIQNIAEGSQCKDEYLKLIEKVKVSNDFHSASCHGGFYIFASPLIVQSEFSGVIMGCQSSPSPQNDGIARIITEMANMFIHKELETINLTQQIINNYAEMELLYGVSEIFGTMLDVDSASQIILERILQSMEAERASLMLIDEETGDLRILFAKGVSEEIIKNTRVKLGEGICGFVAKEGRPLLVESIEEDPRIRDLVIDGNKFRTSSFLSVPLICAPLRIKNKVIGVVNVADKKSGKRFTSYDLNLLSTISTQIAAVIENNRLFNDLRDLFMNTLEALSFALEAKDYYTQGHSSRVSKYALAVADELNLTPQEKRDLELAALLHDIGKIGIPEKILLKPGKLTPEEYEEVKKHPAQGTQILKHIKQLSHIIPGILYHHERFDGKGYPEGLSRDEIPRISKILNIADAFDAMSTNRPYRRALSREESLEEVKKNSGTQFDPFICQAFLRAYEKGNLERI